MAKLLSEVEKVDRAAAREMIRTVVMAQGNIFIRDLMRRKKIAVGVRKEQFETNLIKAINSGQITRADVVAWLGEVEGWGDQTVYLHKVPEALAREAHWASAEAVKGRLPKEQQEVWDKDSLTFPESWALTSISYRDRTLQYTWHQHLETLVRKPDKDHRQVIDGETYQFKAYLVRDDRAVLRFVLSLDKLLAAVFMQIPAEGNGHQAARDLVKDTVKPLVDWDRLNIFSTADVIRNLDQAALDDAIADKVKSRKTRLSDASNYVEFANTSDGGYSDSEPVRAVRLAVRPGSLTGSGGLFVYKARTPTNAERLVLLEVSGEDRRIRLRAQLQAVEVWDILEMLRKYEQWTRPTGRS